MCPDCLKEVIRQKVDAFVADVQSGIQENIAPNYRGNGRELVEGIDFYKENGNHVFTAWYHLKRGDCCGNNCRHCPYEHKNVR